MPNAAAQSPSSTGSTLPSIIDSYKQDDLSIPSFYLWESIMGQSVLPVLRDGDQQVVRSGERYSGGRMPSAGALNREGFRFAMKNQRGVSHE